MLHEFMSNISPNNRPLQQSSPSDNSMSTATPPNQVSRASPASTALVMSSNNINGGGTQPTSRQLTPSNTSSDGTSSSLGDGNGGAANITNYNMNTNNNGQQGGMNSCAPNPMVRQFACHTKSMSAGVVVPVPGISNNLAIGHMNHQNNVMHHNQNNNMSNNQPQHHHVRQISNHVHQSNATNKTSHHNSNNMGSAGNSIKQQVIREQQRSNRQQIGASQQESHHHRSASSHHHHQQYQQQQQQQQQQHQMQLDPHDGSNPNFVSGNRRQAISSSIILSNSNINNIHNRSASTHLSNILLGPQQQQQVQHLQQQQHHNSQTTARNYPSSHVTNSIWSVDEHLSKSRGKLTASGYLPYPFNPSLNDMTSCDNVSNASQLLDGGAPAPAYYPLHAPPPAAGGHGGNLPHSSNAHLSVTGSMKAPEFLPICDLIFNLISMVIYFCENVFEIIALVALYYHVSSKWWALTGAAFVLAANLLCQYLSLKWLYKMKTGDSRRKREAQEELEDEGECERRYYNRMATNMRNYQCGSCTWLPDGATEDQLRFLLSIILDTIMHVLCLGFLVRYVKLVIPVTDTPRVKREIRDLCMLRMFQSFVQSAPLLLLQAYMICSQSYSPAVNNLCIISAISSLVNICWALASFTKYARKKYMHKFTLTWLGILSQLLWRLGTVSSRVAALTIYAVYYNYWMLVVLLLHWITMFLWLIKPGNLLRGEVNLTRSKKVSLAAGAAWIYCFCYMNFEEHNSRAKMGVFYLIMFLENNLLFTVCQTFSTQVTSFKNLSILVVYLGFVFGMLFMFLYYKYFHLTVLNNGLSCSQDSIDSSIADHLSPAIKKVAGYHNGTLRMKSEDMLTTTGRRYNSNISATLHTSSQSEIAGRSTKPPYLAGAHHQQVPMPRSSVFSCKLNPSTKRQKISRHNP